jgi:GT2 family glycosyltransferase
LNPDSPALSIVIVNYRSWEPLSACLHSIEEQTVDIANGLETIVVDNRSADGHLDSFRERFPAVQWIENPVNAGFGVANDLGVEKAKAQRIVFLNPDTVLLPGSLRQWSAAFDRLPKPALAGCPQVGHDGRPRKVGDLFPGPFDALGFVRTWRRKRAGAHTVEWVTGAAVMIERATLDRIGGWGDRYWMYSEDVDLCRRAAEQGVGVFITDVPQIVHAHGGATRRNARITAITKSEVVRSKHIYAERWFRGLPRLTCHLLVATKALLSATLGTLVDLLFLHIPQTLRAQPRLLGLLLGLYAGRLVRGSWRSPRLP